MFISSELIGKYNLASHHLLFIYIKKSCILEKKYENHFFDILHEKLKAKSWEYVYT